MVLLQKGVVQMGVLQMGVVKICAVRMRLIHVQVCPVQMGFDLFLLDRATITIQIYKYWNKQKYPLENIVIISSLDKLKHLGTSSA